MSDKKKIRESVRNARRGLPISYRAAASAKISESFLKLDRFKTASNIAGYLAFDGEADPLGLMLAAHNQGKNVFVPIIVGKQHPLVFAPWSPDSPKRVNQFGIAEPEVPESDWIDPRELDLVVTPLVAFDIQLNRIGVGGGYFDRTFAFRNSNDLSQTGSPKMVGFAFEMQKTKGLSQQQWDVKLDGVITEAKVYEATSRTTKNSKN